MPIPKHISKQQIEQLPDAPGIYYFLDHNDVIIYIGKSIHIKQRVLSHFYASGREHRERKLSLATCTIDYKSTAGELSALLLESLEVKRHNPLFNRRLRRRRSLYSWTLDDDPDSAELELIEAQWPPSRGRPQFGLYRSKTQAKNALLDLAKREQLCCQQLRLESSTNGCFNRQTGRCLGACVGREKLSDHKQRVLAALERHDACVWPYSSAIAVREKGAQQYAVFDSWFFLGHADTLKQASLLPDADGRQLLDRDSFRILLGFLHREEVHELDELPAG